MRNKIERYVIVTPEGNIKALPFDSTDKGVLEKLQKEIGGFIEGVTLDFDYLPWTGKVECYVNEEGINLKLPVNPYFKQEMPFPVLGNVIVRSK